MVRLPVMDAVRTAIVALALAAAGVALAPPAVAQQPAAPAAGQPSAAHVQLGRDLIEANGSMRSLEEVVPAYLGRVRDMFGTNNPDLIGELNQVAMALRAEFDKKRADLVTDIARVYATRFTEAELREMVAFYRTPTGRKFVTSTPVVMQETFDRMQAWTDRLSEEMVQRVRAEMRKKGHTL